MDNYKVLRPPEASEWKCYVFGYPGNPSGSVIFHPLKGQEPNRFHRFMQELCFGVRWVKEPQ